VSDGQSLAISIFVGKFGFPLSFTEPEVINYLSRNNVRACPEQNRQFGIQQLANKKSHRCIMHQWDFEC
jgi:hypothetical protein